MQYMQQIVTCKSYCKCSAAPEVVLFLAFKIDKDISSSFNPKNCISAMVTAKIGQNVQCDTSLCSQHDVNLFWG